MPNVLDYTDYTQEQWFDNAMKYANKKGMLKGLHPQERELVNQAVKDVLVMRISDANLAGTKLSTPMSQLWFGEFDPQEYRLDGTDHAGNPVQHYLYKQYTHNSEKKFAQYWVVDNKKRWVLNWISSIEYEQAAFSMEELRDLAQKIFNKWDRWQTTGVYIDDDEEQTNWDLGCAMIMMANYSQFPTYHEKAILFNNLFNYIHDFKLEHFKNRQITREMLFDASTGEYLVDQKPYGEKELELAFQILIYYWRDEMAPATIFEPYQFYYEENGKKYYCYSHMMDCAGTGISNMFALCPEATREWIKRYPTVAEALMTFQRTYEKDDLFSEFIVWYEENRPSDVEAMNFALRTCLQRGWMEKSETSLDKRNMLERFTNGDIDFPPRLVRAMHIKHLGPSLTTIEDFFRTFALANGDSSEVEFPTEYVNGLVELHVLASEMNIPHIAEQATNIGVSELMKLLTPHDRMNLFQRTGGSFLREMMDAVKNYKDVYQHVTGKDIDWSHATLAELIRLNKTYHDGISQFNKELADLYADEQLKSDKKTKVHRIVDDIWPANDKYGVAQVVTSMELIEEGANMHHCVGSYFSQVSQGSSFIFSVRELETRKPVATFELRVRRASDEEYEKWKANDRKGFNPDKWEMIQLRGHHNSSVSSDIQALVDKFINEVVRKAKRKLYKEYDNSQIAAMSNTVHLSDVKPEGVMLVVRKNKLYPNSLMKKLEAKIAESR